VAILWGRKKKIRELIQYFFVLKFDHNFREENMEADSQSKLALHVPEEKIFFSTWPDVQEGPHAPFDYIIDWWQHPLIISFYGHNSHFHFSG